MEPAATIIGKLGGDTAVAEALGIHRTRVANWKRAKRVGGTDGRVPQWHIQKLIELGATKGLDLTFNDFAWPAPFVTQDGSKIDRRSGRSVPRGEAA
jgi:hypothetical protein